MIEDEPTVQAKPSLERTFTQSDVDKIMMGNRRKLQEDLASAQSRLKELEARPDLESALAQRDGEWQSRVHEVEDIHAKTLTEREAALSAEWQTKLSERDAQHTASLTEWQSRHGEAESKLKATESKYHSHLAKVAIVDAAVAGRALSPAIVTKLLADRTIVDGDRVMVDIGTGSPVAPSEAIEYMRTHDDYAMLFASPAVSGIGGQSGSKLSPGKIDLKSLSGEQYRALRSKNPNLLGLAGGQ